MATFKKGDRVVHRNGKRGKVTNPEQPVSTSRGSETRVAVQNDGRGASELYLSDNLLHEHMTAPKRVRMSPLLVHYASWRADPANDGLPWPEQALRAAREFIEAHPAAMDPGLGVPVYHFPNHKLLRPLLQDVAQQMDAESRLLQNVVHDQVETPVSKTADAKWSEGVAVQQQVPTFPIKARMDTIPLMKPTEGDMQTLQEAIFPTGIDYAELEAKVVKADKNDILERKRKLKFKVLHSAVLWRMASREERVEHMRAVEELMALDSFPTLTSTDKANWTIQRWSRRKNADKHIKLTREWLQRVNADLHDKVMAEANVQNVAPNYAPPEGPVEGSCIDHEKVAAQRAELRKHAKPVNFGPFIHEGNNLPPEPEVPPYDHPDGMDDFCVDLLHLVFRVPAELIGGTEEQQERHTAALLALSDLGWKPIHSSIGVIVGWQRK